MADVYSNAGITASQLAGDSSEMDVVAGRLRSLAQAAAQEHRDSGAFANSIEVTHARGKRGVTDRLVQATDPLGAVKEFGHVIRNEADGPDLGYVPGQHSMRKAYERIAEVRSD